MFVHGNEVSEHVEVIDERVIAAGQQFPPFRAVAFLADLGLHQPEVLRLPVGADDPASVEVLGLVLVISLAGQEDPERQFRISRVGVAYLGGHGAPRIDDDQPLVLGVEDIRVESGIVLLIHQAVRPGVRAEQVLSHAQAEQGHRVLLDVENRTAVRGPGQRGLGILDGVGQRPARREVLEAERVLAPSDRVVRVGQQAAVRADRQVADLVEVAPLGELGGVEHDLLRRLHGALPAGVDRVFPALVVATVVPPAVLLVRDAGVVLLDATHDLAVDPVLERPDRRQHRVLVGVLRDQVGQHVGIRPRVVAQPVVVVDAVAGRRFDNKRPGGRHRRRRWHRWRCRRGDRCGAGLDRQCQQAQGERQRRGLDPCCEGRSRRHAGSPAYQRRGPVAAQLSAQ